ncbi:hypothetical protein BU24DRAFT_231261 [Aaosphaeria arxii CBS 175.79]|uniref:Uncharacterized protein n=1 Tax=Aaosphaeria arxii CBS 175.79 TaxID=1450172 RepID=A0A6A5XJY3_9PLEO|nr:uncharacterized protein BU24DRAFT_231261 [Aaosphaeria arxii CBS 175.79]KAF2013151.1 hypothetical protein BU24DRAFT_231261 [Aaosphaeria arxii CBS 175.79]
MTVRVGRIEQVIRLPYHARGWLCYALPLPLGLLVTSIIFFPPIGLLLVIPGNYERVVFFASTHPSKCPSPTVVLVSLSQSQSQCAGLSRQWPSSSSEEKGKWPVHSTRFFNRWLLLKNQRGTQPFGLAFTLTPKPNTSQQINHTHTNLLRYPPWILYIKDPVSLFFSPLQLTNIPL